MSTKKVILIIICIIIALYAGICIWKYTVLNSLNEKYIQSSKSSNLYYYSDTGGATIEYWRKDNVLKEIIASEFEESSEEFGDSSQTVQLIQWGNVETNEILFLIPINKKYTDNIGFETFTQLPSSKFVSGDTSIFLMSILPNFIIYSKEYNEEKCYCIKYNNTVEYISKENGMPVYISENNLEQQNFRYSFDNVTDADVAKPDITEYSYIQ